MTNGESNKKMEVIDDSSEDDLVQEVIDPARLNNQAEGVVQPDQNTGMDQRLEDLEPEEDEQLLPGPRVRPTDSPLFICKFPILQEAAPRLGPGARCRPGGSGQRLRWTPTGPSCGSASLPRRRQEAHQVRQGRQEGVGQEVSLCE